MSPDHLLHFLEHSLISLESAKVTQFSGDSTERATPVPIPNTAVKPLRADDTARATAWESRSLPEISRGPSSRGGPVFCAPRPGLRVGEQRSDDPIFGRIRESSNSGLTRSRDMRIFRVPAAESRPAFGEVDCPGYLDMGGSSAADYWPFAARVL